MESIERKDTNVVPEEPIKTEEVVSNPDVTERNNSAPSPPPNCSICLGNLINTSFTDSCLHQFCFTCLLQWSKIKTECPLCKQGFKSIIHNVRSEEDYDQYHVQHALQAAPIPPPHGLESHINEIYPLDISFRDFFPMHEQRPFFYRTTLGAGRRMDRLGRSLLNPGAVARREQIPSVPNRVPQSERRRRTNNPLDYRRTVYRHGIYAQRLADSFGRFRECSADYYRRNPTEIDRLIPWLNRELQVLLNSNTPHIAYVLTVITDLLVQYDISSAQFRDRLVDYFGSRTEHFAHELENYARSNFDLVGYDQAVTYHPGRAALSNQYDRAVSPSSTSSSSSNDSVRVVDNGETIDLTLFPPINLSTRRVDNQIIDLNMPTSSSGVPGLYTRTLPHNLPAVLTPDIYTISSDSSSSENECEVIGYVKPRHERTPEIIDLDTSDTEEVHPQQSTSSVFVDSFTTIDESMPSTSAAGDLRTSCRNRSLVWHKESSISFDDWATTPESTSEESDSDYNPTSKSRHHKCTTKKTTRANSRKTVSKKKKSSNPHRKRKERRNRSASSSSDSDDESSKKENTNKGKKRRLSKSSNESSPKKPKKKSKKSKKSKSKKSKKRPISTSDESISTDDDFNAILKNEESNKTCKNKRRKKNTDEACEKSPNHPTRYSSDEAYEPGKEKSIYEEISSKKSNPPDHSNNWNDSAENSSNYNEISISEAAEISFPDAHVSLASSRRSSVDSNNSSKNLTLPVMQEDEESRHTPPVSDDRCRTS